MKKTNVQTLPGRKLSRLALRSINGGACNPGPYYNKPCSNDLQCGGPPCATTLYCYCPPGSSSGVCLFR